MSSDDARGDTRDGTPHEKVYDDLKSLAATIRHYDSLYYLSQPSIPDAEYDELVRREEEICRSNPELLRRLEEESPLGDRVTRYGGRVGPVLDEEGGEGGDADAVKEAQPNLERVRHLAPMLSLENAMSYEDVERWLNRMLAITGEEALEVVAEPKLDGLAMSLRYEIVEEKEGCVYELVRAATRGDGTTGEDVTSAALRIKQVRS